MSAIWKKLSFFSTLRHSWIFPKRLSLTDLLWFCMECFQNLPLFLHAKCCKTCPILLFLFWYKLFFVIQVPTKTLLVQTTTILVIIFWQFTISVNVWFATSKTDLISTIIGFAHTLLHELPEIEGAAEGHQCPHFPSWNEFPKDAIKNYAKADIKIFWSCLILLDFF